MSQLPRLSINLSCSEGREDYLTEKLVLGLVNHIFEAMNLLGKSICSLIEVIIINPYWQEVGERPFFSPGDFSTNLPVGRCVQIRIVLRRNGLGDKSEISIPIEVRSFVDGEKKWLELHSPDKSFSTVIAEEVRKLISKQKEDLSFLLAAYEEVITETYVDGPFPGSEKNPRGLIGTLTMESVLGLDNRPKDPVKVILG